MAFDFSLIPDLPGLPAAPVGRWLRDALPDLIQDGP